MEDRKSWAIKDEAILDDLVTLMNVTDEETAILGSLHEEAAAAADDMIEAFYERLLTHAPTAEYLEGMVEHF
jgi:hypothetical protein